MTNAAIPATMRAVLLTGHGGPEMLDYRSDVAVPKPADDEVLIRVAAAGVNNTDINTRVGWYSKTGAADDAGWSGVALDLPRIQGADICGHVVAVGRDVAPERVGERVICTAMQQSRPAIQPFVTETVGSEMDGGFAEYAVMRSLETFAVDCGWTDAELGSVPCASSTAENMLHRIDVARGERVLITGASGGVGSAAVQLTRRRGAHVVAVVGQGKEDAVRAIGADEIVGRDASLLEACGHESFDAVIDLVGGPSWPDLLDLLRRGGRYVTSGAIAGPIVELDVRTLYLKDLTLHGATYQDPVVFENLVGYIERGEIRPLVHATYPLADIARAQSDFAAKDFVGKLVLIP